MSDVYGVWCVYVLYAYVVFVWLCVCVCLCVRRWCVVGALFVCLCV